MNIFYIEYKYKNVVIGFKKAKLKKKWENLEAEMKFFLYLHRDKSIFHSLVLKRE